MTTSRALRGVIIHASAVGLSKFRMLTRGYCVASSSCGLNNVTLTSEMHFPLLRRHVVSFFLWSTCELIPAFHCVVRAAIFMHGIYGILRIFQIFLHDLRIAISLLFGCDASQFDFLCFLD